MQKQIIDGVPYYVDASNKLYTWDKEPHLIGTYNPTTKSVQFQPSHLAELTGHLTAWRALQVARARKSNS
jgi:hypothetical protein